MWKSSSTSLEAIAIFSGVHDLRSYLHLHEHLGEPAIRKVARQVLKGVTQPLLAMSTSDPDTLQRCGAVSIAWLVLYAQHHLQRESMLFILI